MINYDNIDTVWKQNILEKIVELMKKYNLRSQQNLIRIDRVRLKEKNKFMGEVIDSVHTNTITKENNLVKCRTLVITKMLGIKEIKNNRKEKPL